MKKKMIIIGANGSGTKRTVPALNDSEICKIVALQSRNQEKLQQTCLDYGIANYYSDPEEMLEKEDYDLVFIANPPFMHKATIAQCTKYQKPIICEKPLAGTFDEAKEIADLLVDYPQPFMVAHHLRHQKAYPDLKQLINNNRTGRILSVWAQWGFNINPAAASSQWKLRKDLGGAGTFSDNGIHAVDFIVGLFGSDCSVMGISRVLDYENSFSNELMILSYKDKDVVINSSHTMPYPGNHLLIYGTSGSIEIACCFSEKSLKKIIINTTEQEVLEYPEENVYKNEVENFIKYYMLGNDIEFYGSSLQEQLDTLRIIDELREKQLG